MIVDQKSILLQDALSDLQTRNYSSFTTTIAELFSQHLTCNCFLRSVGKESWQTMFRRIDLIDDPISFEILIAKGFICMMCDRSDLAFQHFTDAISINDELEIGYALRANIGEQHNPFSLNDCKILADKNPSSRNYFLLGNALRQENSIASSKYFQKTVELDAGFACAHYNLGRQYQRDKLFDCAIKEFVECLSIEPNHWCYLDLWECVVATDGPEAAMKYLDVGHVAHPNNNSYHYAYGVAYKILEEYEVSRRHFHIYTNWNYSSENESNESLEEL